MTTYETRDDVLHAADAIFLRAIHDLDALCEAALTVKAPHLAEEIGEALDDLDDLRLRVLNIEPSGMEEG